MSEGRERGMDRETRRLVEEFRRNDAGADREQPHRRAGRGRPRSPGVPPARDRLRARRRHDRAAPAVRRRAEPAFGAPMRAGEDRRNAPRRHASPTTRVSSRTSCGRPARSASPAFRGEYLTFSNNKLAGEAVARHELEAERDLHRLDVPDPQGRQVPQRQDHDRGRRRRELQAVPHAEDVADPLGASRRTSSSRPAWSRPGRTRCSSA